MDKVQYYSTPDQSIGMIEGQYQSFEFQRHYHLDFHFGLIHRGQQQFAYHGERYRIGQGDLVVMPPDELHDGRSMLDSGYQFSVFTIDPSWFETHFDFQQSVECLSFSGPVIKDPQVFLPLFQAHYGLRRADSCQLAKDCLPYEGFMPLLERYSEAKLLAPQPLGNTTLAQLRDFMMANLAEPIHLAELAALCDLSPTQFQRHFKATAGMTPYAWLSRLRLEHAMKLLKAQVPGTDVAQRVGFYDQAHFSKAFKQTFGVPPSDIR